jgi:hypothetical protein
VDLERKLKKYKHRTFALQTELTRAEDNNRLERGVVDFRDRLSFETGNN